MSTPDESELIVVHTGESRSMLWNPATHEEVRNEMPDGNVVLTVRPKLTPPIFGGAIDSGDK